ncbi:MAG: YceI family protein [Spirosomaceae bacterium]|nr:YceI family protein [Spirosomataceae bacterium]
MKKYLTILLIFSAGLTLNAQRFICKSGETSFFSETPLEDIQAVSKTVTAIIDVPSNAIAVKMQIADFTFPNKLMQEHFNENYLESEKYPSGVFSGKINEKIDYAKDGTYNISATGKLQLHGVTQVRTLKGKMTIKNGLPTLICAFDVKLADHKIDIPTIVVAKIAENIEIKNTFAFSKQ